MVSVVTCTIRVGRSCVRRELNGDALDVDTTARFDCAALRDAWPRTAERRPAERSGAELRQAMSRRKQARPIRHLDDELAAGMPIPNGRTSYPVDSRHIHTLQYSDHVNLKVILVALYHSQIHMTPLN